MKHYEIGTLCVQEGYYPKNGEARTLPIYQSTTFKYDSSEHVGRLFDLQENGFFYSRLANPTVDCVEKKIAALEGGVGAVCTSSGQAAIMLSVLNLCSAGDHIVASAAIYGGAMNLLGVTLKRMGIEVDFVNPDSTLDELIHAGKENTKLYYAETIANPSLVVIDIEKWATAAHSYQVPFMIDNTFATPIQCRPFEYGADLVVHSTSKYMDGHAVVLGGAIVDSGKFDWSNGKFESFTTPDESYHGIVYTEHFKEAVFLAKARVQLMRDMGSVMSANSAFLLNLGLETLHLRVKKHCENALHIAQWLEKHEKIGWVNYPSLKGNPYNALAKKYLPNGTCGVISFGVKGGREAAVQFMDALKLASIVVHVADVRTSVLHPASTTHRQLTNEQLIAAGVPFDLIRMSIGIEEVSDIICDIEQALQQI